MVTQNPGAGGQHPQAQGLREIEEDADALRALLQGLIDHAANKNEQLGTAVVEYHRRALQLEDEIDRLGADNQCQVEDFIALRAQLLDKLRQVPELQRLVRLKSWEGQRLSHDKVLLQDEVQRLEAFVRLLQAELQENEGGGNLPNGESTMQTSREWLFLLVVFVATVLGIASGIVTDYFGANWTFWVGGTVAVVVTIMAVIASQVGWGSLPTRLPLASFFWPEVSLDNQQSFKDLLTKAELIKTRPVDGLVAREVELVTARNNLTTARTDLAQQIRDLRDGEVGDLIYARDLLRTKLQEHQALCAVAPPVQASIDAAWDDYNAAIDTLCDMADNLPTPTQAIISKLDQIQVLSTAIESSPGGLVATVERLKGELATAEDDVKRARERANAFYTYPRWYIVLGMALVLVTLTMWDYYNVNKIIGQSRIAEGKPTGIWISGGEVMADPSKRELYLIGCEELPIGKDGPVTAVKQADGRILVFLGAGQIDSSTRAKIELSEYSAPR